METVVAIYREPFSFEPKVRRQPVGLSLAEMADRMPDLPRGFEDHGVICINGHPAPRALWHGIRPKSHCEGVTIEVTFHAAIMGGGDDGKNPFAIIAAIAITALSGGIAAGTILAGVTGGAGTLAATALAAGVSIVGSLLISALVPPPTLSNGPDRPDRVDRGSASAQGNVLEPNGPMPRVTGTRKIFPPHATEPFTYFDGNDEVVEAVYALAGPHEMTDIRIADAPIAEVTDVVFQTREGWAGDAAVTLVERQTRTEPMRTELRGHRTSDDDGKTLESVTGDFSAALPQPTTYASREDPDEIWFDVSFPQGLHKNASETDFIRVPLRMRMREVGSSTWINLPELHFQGADISEARASIRLKWTDSPSLTLNASGSKGWVEARILNPDQTVAPASAGWAAHSYFDDGSGDDYMDSANLGSTAVQNVSLSQYIAEMHLDTATFPKGRYEIEVERGYAFRDANYSASAYTISSVVRDPMAYESGPVIFQSQDGISSAVVLVRGASIWNEHPIASNGMALIAVQARNRRVERVSALASGYVPDWDGSGWNTWTTTSNPAPHYRDVLAGNLNADPVPASLVDDTGLVAWRTACTSLGYEVNAIVEGQTVADVTRLIASAGYAKPYEADIWGVTRDFDRSAETPVQIFTPRNSANFSWKKAFPKLPEGFRVTFADKDRDYERRQITVYRDPNQESGGLTEQVTYEAIVEEADVRARAAYDFAAAQSRSAFYSLLAPAEAIVCRRGSLVGVAHDSLDELFAQGRIVDIEESGGLVDAITLDEEIDIQSEVTFDLLTDIDKAGDLSKYGTQTGVVVRRSNDTRTIHAISNAAGAASRLTFSPPIDAAGMDGDNLISIGRVGTETRRMIVFAMRPKEELNFELTFVDEAAEIWA